jgi:hypothetical protein
MSPSDPPGNDPFTPPLPNVFLMADRRRDKTAAARRTNVAGRRAYDYGPGMQPQTPPPSPSVPVASAPLSQGLSAFAQAVLTEVAREAEGAPEIEAAFVRPDGLEFMLTGSVRLGAGIAVAVAVLERVQRKIAPSFEPLLDGTYRPTGKRMVQGWLVAFERT